MIKLIKETTGTDVRFRNQYEIEVEFMHGDGDGESTEYVRFNDVLITDPEFVTELEEFLIMINACIKQDAQGRGGIETMKECIGEYGYINNWTKFNLNLREYRYDENKLREMVGIYYEKMPEFSEYLTLEIPYDYEGWFASYVSVNVYYYDNTGNKYNVTVEYS